MSKTSSLRRVPWLLVFELARMTRGHVMDATSPAERRRALDIVRRSKGDPRKVSERDKAELKKIAAKLDLKTLMAGAAPALMRSKKR
ncbi:MAG: hypothetical protein JWP17_1455 [Solirubrobacterales bacterium]|jgi:hypothetical protein|nr:hypothetical protein [Solirubrobacterales bacterium]